jgi:hypothetical protein
MHRQAAGEGAGIRFGGGDVGQLGFPPSLPLTTLGVCQEKHSSSAGAVRANMSGASSEGDILITKTGACILPVGGVSPVTLTMWFLYFIWEKARQETSARTEARGLRVKEAEVTALTVGWRCWCLVGQAAQQSLKGGMPRKVQKSDPPELLARL